MPKLTLNAGHQADDRTVANGTVDTITIPSPGAYVRLTNRSGGAPVLFRLDGQYPVYNAPGTRKLSPAQFSEVVIPTPTSDPVTVTVTTTSPSVSYSVTVLPADVQDWPTPPALPAA